MNPTLATSAPAAAWAGEVRTAPEPTPPGIPCIIGYEAAELSSASCQQFLSG